MRPRRARTDPSGAYGMGIFPGGDSVGLVNREPSLISGELSESLIMLKFSVEIARKNQG